MKKLSTLLLFGGILLAAVSCKKGECTCSVLGSDVTTAVESDTHSDYKDAKKNCEDAGCDWKAKL